MDKQIAMRRAIRFIFRGEVVELGDVAPTLTLLDWLREQARATGTKEGCNEGDCGACTVVLLRAEAGRLVARPVTSCITLVGQLDGAELVTVEDLAAGGALHPIQAAMVKHHGSQCGFCTPGIVMSLFASHHAGPWPATRSSIEEALAGNLCRCTGYRPIIDAALEALASPPADRYAAGAAERLARLAAFNDGRDLLMGDEARFFAAPASLESLADLALRHPDATFLAGATDVGLWVTKKLKDLRKIIWLGHVEGFGRIEAGAEGLFIGAGATLEAATAALGALDPDLASLMRRFGSRQVRAAGTLGGNIANGSPIGDLAPALIALGATLHLRRSGLTRRMPLEAYFLDYGRQDRDAGEFILGVTVPALAAGQHFRAFKISKRFDEDISALMGAFRFTIAAGKITEARLAFGGMAGVPKRASATEAALAGAAPGDPQTIAVAIAMLDRDFTPISDMRASAHYRARVARAVLGKAILEIAGASAATRIHPRGEKPHAA